MSRGGRLGGQGPGQYRNSPLNGFGGPMPSMPMGSPQMNPNKGGSRMSLADMQAPGGFGGPSPLAQAKFPQQNDYAVGRPNMDILTGNQAAPNFEQGLQIGNDVASNFEQGLQQRAMMQMQPQLMAMQPQRAMMEMQSQRFNPLMSGGLASLPFSRPRFMR